MKVFNFFHFFSVQPHIVDPLNKMSTMSTTHKVLLLTVTIVAKTPPSPFLWYLLNPASQALLSRIMGCFSWLLGQQNEWSWGDTQSFPSDGLAVIIPKNQQKRVPRRC